MLVRILFALLALAALVILLSPPPGNIPEADPLPRKLLLVAILVTVLGMVVRWGRWIYLDSPRGNLAFVSKLLGWAGASGVPLALASRDVVAVLVCVLLPLLAFALWSGRAWAAWPWYAVSLACLAAALWGLSVLLFMLLFRFTVQGLSEEVCIGMMIVWVLFWGSTSIALMRGLTAWRRGLRLPSEAHTSAPAS